MTYKLDLILESDNILIKRLDYSHCEIEQLDLSILTEQEKERFQNFLSDKRRLEFYFTRVLVRSFNLNSSIQYVQNGKPVIDKGHISISHSKQTIIVAYSLKNYIGIDIEYFKEKIQRIKHKFLAEDEYKFLDTNNIKELTTVWSIKEAVYKHMNIPGLLFNENIVILNTSGQPKLEIRLNGKKTVYNFEILYFEEYLITYLFHPEELS